MIRLAKSLPKPIYKPKPKVEPVEEVKIEPSTALNQEKEIELLASIHETLNKPEEKEVEEVEPVKVVFPEVQKVQVLNFPEQKECKHEMMEMPEFPSEIRVSNLDEIKQGALPKGLATEKEQVTGNDLLAEMKSILDKLKFNRDGELKTTGSGFPQNGAALLGGRGVMPVGASTSANQDLEIAALGNILTQLEAVLDVSITNTITTRPEYLITQLDDAGSGITYVGKAAAGTATSSAAWQIFRIDESSAPDMNVLYADGVTTFTKEWDDRSLYSYS